VRAITPAVKFTRNLDLSERRAIERRLAEIQPFVTEAQALRKRLENINRRLGVESYSRMAERTIMELLLQHPVGLPRHIIIRDCDLTENVVKGGLERLRERGRVTSPARGHWRVTASYVR